MQSAILFDINETVLDLSPLRPKFKRYFNDESYTELWFSMLLHSSTVCITTGVSTDLKRLSRAALISLSGRLNVPLSNAECDDVLNTFASLPAHSDILPALNKLKQAGFTLAAFSNSSLLLLESQLTSAGLIQHFDKVISVESAGTFKPAKSAYHFALKQLDVSPNQARLIAAHDWDTHGAISAGLNAAFINRFGAHYNSEYIVPDIVGDTMGSVVTQIINAAEK
ncbi:haloacid dehalogenase type II [Vibrio sp. FNV 38]|nr:haloacid dehalogenase type II [Vibrio sp. FNV 38]